MTGLSLRTGQKNVCGAASSDARACAWGRQQEGAFRERLARWARLGALQNPQKRQNEPRQGQYVALVPRVLVIAKLGALICLSLRRIICSSKGVRNRAVSASSGMEDRQRRVSTRLARCPFALLACRD